MLESLPIVCVDIIITNGKEVLLVKRNEEPAKGLWWLPGGRLFKNENLEKCALRKAKEEAGVEAEIVRKIGFYETFFEKHSVGEIKNGYHTINVCFLLKAKSSDVVLDKTSGSFRWISESEEGLDPYVKGILDDSGIL